MTSEETDEKVRQLTLIADKERELEDAQENYQQITAWIEQQPISSENRIATDLSKEFNMSLTDAKKSFEQFPPDYSIEGKNIPQLVKDLRMFRRTLKGEHKKQFTSGIETLVGAYSNHLSSCIKSIYWLEPYEIPLKKMGFKEPDLKKLHAIKSGGSRRNIVETICKYWEAELDRKEVPYNSDYSTLSKTMKKSKRKFREILKGHRNTSPISKQIDNEIIKSVCNAPGITCRQILDRLPPKLQRRASPQIVSKSASRLNIAIYEEQYFKLPDMIKKDVYSYTAAFIDSDGYITMDTNYSPRVGLVATGNRGKAFLTELQKSLGIGRLVLDEKSPQNTRPVNRLNFYSQGQITELLTKCRPHLRMKGPQADLLLELIRIKKNYKKSDWAKERYGEIFKLMKWNNHGENPNFDWSRYEIDVENVSKLELNCKMPVMDDLEGIKKDVDDAIDDLEEVAEGHELSDEDWESVDDASDYLFEHKVKNNG